MKVWHALLSVVIATALFSWLSLSLTLSFTRVATGNCPSQEYINNGWINSDWFCK
jgi:type II secretory pathway component PulJ